MAFVNATTGFSESNLASEVTSVTATLQASEVAVLLMSIAAGACSFITVIGNVVVILSFFVNQSLRNFSNYLILSLAFSDLTIGAFSMNVYITYNVHKEWILGPYMCKAWLSVDYMASNASVMNLLVICVDRYIAITKPVKYRRWSTERNAGIAIAVVWSLSFFLWVPAITLWDVWAKDRFIGEGQCYIPFIEDSAFITILTICTAFYIPAIIMCGLYQRVIHKIRNRRRGGIRSIIYDASTTLSEKKKLTKTKTSNSELEDRYTQSSSEEKFTCENKAPPNTFARVRLFKVYNLLRKKNNQQNVTEEGASSTIQIDHTELLKTPNPEACDAVSNKDDICESIVNNVINQHTVNHASVVENKPVSSTAEYSMTTKRTTTTIIPALSKGQGFESFRQRSSSNRMSQREIRERRVTVLLKFILLGFIILWLPYSLLVVIAALCENCHIPPDVWNLSYWLCYLNSTVNPLCYGYCNENFRRTFKVIMTSKWWTPESRKQLRTGRKQKAIPSRKMCIAASRKVVT